MQPAHLNDDTPGPMLQVVRPTGAPSPLTHWAHTPDAVLFHQDPDLTPTARVLYAVLLAHKNRDTGQCNPGEERLATLLPCLERTVRSGVAVLKRLGWITVERARYVPAKDKRAATNHYTLLLDNSSHYTPLHAHVLYDPTLSPEAKYAYALIAHRQRRDDQTCRKSLAELAKKAGIKLPTLKRWVAELSERGYLDQTQRVFGRAAERHVTFMPLPRQQRVHRRALDRSQGAGAGAEPSVKQGAANANGSPVASANGSLVASANGSLVACRNGSPVAGKGEPLNKTPGNQGPLPRPVPAGPSPEALNQKTAPATRADAAKPRQDALRASASLAQSGTSQSGGTGGLQGGGGGSEGVQLAFVENLVHGPRVVPAALHLPSGDRTPRAPSAGRPAVKTRDATDPGKVRLTAMKIADLDPAWPLAQQIRFEAEWAARLFLKRVCGQDNSHLRDKKGLPLYPAYRDICYRILLDMESDHERYEEWVDYMADPEYKKRVCKGRKPLRSFWYKRPALLWEEAKLWSPGLEARTMVFWPLLPGMPSHENCIGCMLGTDEEDCFRDPGQLHRPDCLLGRPGPVGDDDWRLSRLLECLREQEEHA